MVGSGVFWSISAFCLIFKTKTILKWVASSSLVEFQGQNTSLFKSFSWSLSCRNTRGGNVCQGKISVSFCTRPNGKIKTISELLRQRDRKGSSPWWVNSLYTKYIWIYKYNKYNSCPSPQLQQSLSLQSGKRLRTTGRALLHLPRSIYKNTLWTTENPSPPAACAIHTPNPALVVWNEPTQGQGPPPAGTRCSQNTDRSLSQWVWHAPKTCLMHEIWKYEIWKMWKIWKYENYKNVKNMKIQKYKNMTIWVYEIMKLRKL